LTATASDAVSSSGLASVAFYYRTATDNATWGAWTLYSTDTAAAWTASFVWPANGYYQFYSRATDRAANVEAAPASADTIAMYDNVLPASVVTTITPYQQTSTPLTVVATATDASPSSGIASVALWYRSSVDNATWSAWTLVSADTTSPYSWSFAMTANTYYQFYSIAVDKAGNTELAPASRDTACFYYVAGATATATGPIGSGPYPGTVTLTYTTTGTPMSVDIYYTTNGGASWTLAVNDATPDGSYASWTIPAAGTYGWLASAVGGGSVELSPPTAGTAPEAASYVAGSSAAPRAQGLTVTKVSPNIVLTWTNATNPTTDWNIYYSTNKFAAFPGGWTQASAVATARTWTHTNAYADGNTWFYIVRGDNGGTLSANSTMGVKMHRAFTVNAAPATNVMWMTIPQDTAYATASDIVMELEGALVGAGLDTKINVVGKWVPGGQASTQYLYDSDFEEWTGDDFAINAGDGIYLSITSTFNWVVVGVDVGTQLVFTVNAAPATNVIWFNLAATNSYTSASDIVLELEGALVGAGLDTKINVVGKWVPGGQASTQYLYDSDFEEWTGDDFTIAPGDGIYISITSSFNWTPAMLTAPFP
jgi:hypothetical protein